MDMIFRFWNSENNKVAERYFNSEFIGHATTGDMLTHLKNGIVSLNPSSLVLLSMDGCSVNLRSFITIFFKNKKMKNSQTC